MDLKSIRKSINLTQIDAAKFLDVSRRSYQYYENDPSFKRKKKYKYFCERLNSLSRIDYTHGIYKTEDLILKIKKIMKEYRIKFCYLYGSYARGDAKETSDINLLIDSNIVGIRLLGLIEELKFEIRKKIDIINVDCLYFNKDLINSILKYNIRII